jgi:hypothetical protein
MLGGEAEVAAERKPDGPEPSAAPLRNESRRDPRRDVLVVPAIVADIPDRSQPDAAAFRQLAQRILNPEG